MGDRFPSEIKIGGKIPRSLLPELADKLVFEGVNVDWGVPVDGPGILKTIEHAAELGRVAVFTDHEADYGCFIHLESWLTRHGIDFDRHHEARCEYNAEWSRGRGTYAPISSESDQNGRDVVDVAVILEILDCDDWSYRTKISRIRRALRLQPVLGPVVIAEDE